MDKTKQLKAAMLSAITEIFGPEVFVLMCPNTSRSQFPNLRALATQLSLFSNYAEAKADLESRLEDKDYKIQATRSRFRGKGRFILAVRKSERRKCVPYAIRCFAPEEYLELLEGGYFSEGRMK